jgi:acetylglutamate kinase
VIPRFLSRLYPTLANPPLPDKAQSAFATARTLAEALPFIQRYDRETVVIKYGGHAMGDVATAQRFAADVVLLKLVGMHPVVVHGGGPQISAMLGRAGVKSEFVDGLRVTDPATMEIAEMVLSGAVNKQLAHLITQAGTEADVRGVGLSGKDARLFTVEKVHRTRKDPESHIEQVVDLGFVGDPKEVDAQLVTTLIKADQDYVPVVAPIGVDEAGATYNINADTAAGALASALGAKRFLLLTDIEGVKDASGTLIDEMTIDQARDLMASGVANGGMIPKLETAIAAIEAGVGAVVILDGRTPHAILNELFTDQGSGTLIRK